MRKNMMGNETVYTIMPIEAQNGKPKFAIFRKVPKDEYWKYYMQDDRIVQLCGEYWLFLFKADAPDDCRLIFEELDGEVMNMDNLDVG